MRVKLALIAAVVVLAAIAGYAIHTQNQTRAQQREIAALVGSATEQLKQVLAQGATARDLAQAEANRQALRDMKATRQRALANVAEHYLISARTIVRSRVEASRLAEPR